MKTIGFICTGNTCRSPMAECYFKHLTKSNDINTFSAGIAAGSGWKASPEACKVMSYYGLDLSMHLSKLLTTELIDSADMLIVMTEMHKNDIVCRWPSVKNKVFLLREFDKDADFDDLNVFDPIGCPEEVYEKCFELMKKSLEHLGEIICKE